MITAKQQRVLEAIVAFVDKHYRQPTLAEVASSLSLSESGIHKHVKNLIHLGVLLQCDGKAAYRLPDALDYSLISEMQTCTHFSYEIPPSIPLTPSNESSLPYVGVIAAGKPIEAVTDVQQIDLAKRFCGPDRYILRISGDSMIEAGLMDGDYIVVNKQATAERGDVVVALIDRLEATLKYFHPIHSKGLIELRPANALMKPMVYELERITVQGVVVGSFRHF